MQGRRFLGIAGTVGAGLGFTGAQNIIGATGPVDQRRGGGGQTLVISLNGEWSTLTDPDNVGRQQAWFRTPPSEANTTQIPSIIQETFPAYHGVVWYWREFQPQPHPYPDGRYLLRFNEVDYLADVWLNGTHLGQHEGADTPFVFDATSAILPSQSNHLVVRVLNPGDVPIDGYVLAETPHLDKMVRYVNGGVQDYGGILEPVQLILTPAVRVKDIHVVPDWKTGVVQIHTTVHNALNRATRTRVDYVIEGPTASRALLSDAVDAELPAGDTVVDHEIRIHGHHLWDIQDPNLYRVQVRVEPAESGTVDEASTSFGFRDFRIVNGYFRLNGRRVFVRSTHTGNHTPFGINIPPPGSPDMLRRDLLYAKASGYNMIRFISGVAHPYQLDLCDEVGLMIYQEPRGAWLLKDSPHMKERYEISLREMILRDRNHPCISMWGMLNETGDGPVFREAVSALSLVRSLDNTRLVLLSSGRFDGHLEIGSASNPGSCKWEPTWGKEGPGEGQTTMKYPSGPGSGDFHLYPQVPQTSKVNHFIRTLGEDSKPVFLSEYGIGSMMDVIHEVRMYEQAGVREDAEDYVLMRSMADHLADDWKRFGMEVVYPDPETLLHESQALMARHRLLGFNLIRSNPRICGFNLTGMLDHGMTGEGMWRFWRDWKPGAFDALNDGWASVRWCLFVEPLHTYVGRPITLEAVLANEDVVRPGTYPADFRVWGPNGLAWKRQANVQVVNPPDGLDGLLAIPVLKEQVQLSGPGGTYNLKPYVQGIAPPEASWEFYLSDPASLPTVNARVSEWGLPAAAASWLQAHGATVSRFASEAPSTRELILVGDVSANSQASDWRQLVERLARGATVIFLSPLAFKRGKDTVGWLPLTKKGEVQRFSDMLYHKENVAKPHPIFAGLQGYGSMLNWYYWGEVWPHYIFRGQDTPAEVHAAAFATGYSTPGGYASGLLMSEYRLGAGRFILSTFPVLEHLDEHPAADRLLLNLVQYGAEFAKGPTAPLPGSFQSLLSQIGYNS